MWLTIYIWISSFSKMWVWLLDSIKIMSYLALSRKNTQVYCSWVAQGKQVLLTEWIMFLSLCNLMNVDSLLLIACLLIFFLYAFSLPRAEILAQEECRADKLYNIFCPLAIKKLTCLLIIEAYGLPIHYYILQMIPILQKASDSLAKKEPNKHSAVKLGCPGTYLFLFIRCYYSEHHITVLSGWGREWHSPEIDKIDRITF